MRGRIFLIVAVTAYAQTDSGRRIFESQCALCHGENGGGARGPNLRRAVLLKAPDDKTLRQVIENGISPEMPGAWQLDPKEVDSVAAYVRSLGKVPAEALAGDATRGRSIYLGAGCPGCHILAGEGRGYGPELTAIGAKRSAAFLKQTLLDPVSTLPDGFLEMEADGIRCLLVNEDTFTLQCRGSDGRFHSFRKDALKSLRKFPGQSPMSPAGKALSPPGLDDLVAYLAAQKGKP